MKRTKAWVEAVVRHGRYLTRAYRVWIGIKARCENKNHRAYADYGGRGIRVCDRWKMFLQFYEDMGDPPPGATIERKDNDKGYEPSNCRWATRRDQVRNRRNTIYLTYRGLRLPLWSWAERLGVRRHTLFYRLKRGWSHARTITTPININMRNGLAKGPERILHGRS